jgi:Fe-Mn family superoxide dismutase
MKHYEPKTFTVPELNGISGKNIEEHLKLYQGYVKNANLIIDKIAEYMADSEKNAYVLGELQRRFSFEFNGIRNHEHYFAQLEGGPKLLPDGSKLKNLLISQASSFEAWLTGFKAIAMTRGIGWAILYWDPTLEQLTHGWVDEQHLGHLVGLTPILMLDMWEHSYVADYHPSGKKQYIEDYLAQVNWETVAARIS